jgi:hypothetical protein
MARSDDTNRRAEYGTRRVLPVWFVAIGSSAGSVPMDDILFVPLLGSTSLGFRDHLTGGWPDGWGPWEWGAQRRQTS